MLHYAIFWQNVCVHNFCIMSHIISFHFDQHLQNINSINVHFHYIVYSRFAKHIKLFNRKIVYSLNEIYLLFKRKKKRKEINFSNYYTNCSAYIKIA